MADINATDLAEEILSTLSGNEQFVMFDPIEGKRAALSVIANYIAEHGEINGDDIPTIITAIQNELTDVKQDLSDKADQNGVYPDLSAGNITGDFHEDTKPYLYRALRDVASHIGSKAFDTLVGGTVAVNQLLQNGDFSDGTNNWLTESDVTFSVSSGVATFKTDTANNGIRQVLDAVNGHKYAVFISAWADSACTLRIALNSSSQFLAQFSVGTSKAQYSSIKEYTGTTGLKSIYIYPYNATDLNVHIDSIMLIDLTQLFASDPTIADRAYTLEQNTAGSGIAWLKSYGYIRDGYIPYNAGTLQSVLTTGKKVVGFNQFNKDATWTSAGNYILNDSGQQISDNSSSYYLETISVLPNTDYYSLNGMLQYGLQRIYFFDAGGNFISRTAEKNSEFSFTTPSNCYGIKIQYHIDELDISKWCINLSKSTGTPKNGDYLSYESVSYQISPEELRGTLKLVNNEIQYNGDIRYADGTKEVNYAAVDLGTLNYTYATYGVSQRFYATIEAAKNTDSGARANAICAKYITESSNTIYANNVDKVIDVRGTTVSIVDSAYTDPAVFKTAMSGVYLIFEKATPTTETVDPFTSPQQVFSDGTEEYIDTRTVPIPVGHETKYELDLAEKLIGLPWDLSMLAPIENGTTASQAYAAGKYFVRNNEFCKAKTSIASGATFTLGTNYEVTTVGAELFTLA